MKRSRAWMPIMIVAAALVALGAGTEGEKTAAEPTTEPTGAEPAKPLSEAEKVLEQMRRQRQDAPPLIEPSVDPGGRSDEAGLLPQMRTRPNPAVIGVAPGAKPPHLRREGEFVTSRRGRVVLAPGSDWLLFHFEGDAPASPETPMFLMPCRLLESIEQIVQARGDQAVFVVTGQVFVYRGANYLLPTMFVQSRDKGNLMK